MIRQINYYSSGMKHTRNLHYISFRAINFQSLPDMANEPCESKYIIHTLKTRSNYSLLKIMIPTTTKDVKGPKTLQYGEF